MAYPSSENAPAQAEASVPLLSIGVHVRNDGSPSARQLQYVPVIMAAAPAPKVADVLRMSMTLAALPRGKAYAKYSVSV